MGAAVRALLLLALVAAGAEALSLDVHHRYCSLSLAAAVAPAPGPGGPFAFADGNDTYRLNAFGFLHYAVVALGTPNVTFLVALDTGSDLFWVPCDCLKCAPLSSPEYGFDVYSPRKSSTSRKVPCSSSLCDLQTQCNSAASKSCPYSIEYLSDNTSSNGVLIEDVLYLASESGKSKITQAPITFGAAPNGLLGLGMDSKSVPSLLASQGVAANSFSMCFGEDGHGRINFGDTGSADQLETPLNIYKHNPYYNISIIGAMAGENFMSGLKVVFDRERLVLGWKSFNCYSVDHSSKLPVSPNPSAVPPKPASGPGSSNPEAAKRPSPNITQIDVAKPSSGSSVPFHFSSTFFAAIAPLLLLAIL
uniref:Uncharacterized protein n=1 Tax=Aegilops tauschii TaxID=37682 RepID=M8CG06_AEGTA